MRLVDIKTRDLLHEERSQPRHRIQKRRDPTKRLLSSHLPSVDLASHPVQLRSLWQPSRAVFNSNSAICRASRNTIYFRFGWLLPARVPRELLRDLLDAVRLVQNAQPRQVVPGPLRLRWNSPSLRRWGNGIGGPVRRLANWWARC